MARIRIGSGCGGCRSGNGEEGGSGVAVAEGGRSLGDTMVWCYSILDRGWGNADVVSG